MKTSVQAVPSSTGSTRRSAAAATNAEKDENSDDFLRWLQEFETRMRNKEEAKDQKEMQRLMRAGKEMDAWHAWHCQQEREERLKEIEAQHQMELDEQARKKEQEEITEQQYFERMTASLTPRSRERWISDQRELEKWEKAYTAKESNLMELNSHITKLVDAYEQRIRKEEEAALELQREAQRRQDEFLAAQKQEREDFLEDVLQGRQVISEEAEATARLRLKEEQLHDCEDALSRSRCSAYQSLGEAARLQVDKVVDAAARNALLDELIQMNVLRNSLKKIMSKGAKEAPNTK